MAVVAACTSNESPYGQCRCPPAPRATADQAAAAAQPENTAVRSRRRPAPAETAESSSRRGDRCRRPRSCPSACFEPGCERVRAKPHTAASDELRASISKPQRVPAPACMRASPRRKRFIGFGQHTGSSVRWLLRWTNLSSASRRRAIGTRGAPLRQKEQPGMPQVGLFLGEGSSASVGADCGPRPASRSGCGCWRSCHGRSAAPRRTVVPPGLIAYRDDRPHVTVLAA
jgi:hypothetical protein